MVTVRLILMHGSAGNAITGDSALTNYSRDSLPEQPASTSTSLSRAVERVKNYKEMSKAELDSAYDAMLSSDQARAEGMKMHKAFFNKPELTWR